MQPRISFHSSVFWQLYWVCLTTSHSCTWFALVSSLCVLGWKIPRVTKKYILIGQVLQAKCFGYMITINWLVQLVTWSDDTKSSRGRHPPCKCLWLCTAKYSNHPIKLKDTGTIIATRITALAKNEPGSERVPQECTWCLGNEHHLNKLLQLFPYALKQPGKWFPMGSR